MQNLYSYGERQPRTIAELMALDNFNVSKNLNCAYKEVSATEAHDLYCIGKELIINSYTTPDTFWQPFRLSRRLVKLEGLNASFKEIINDIVSQVLPKAGDLHYFVILKKS